MNRKNVSIVELKPSDIPSKDDCLCEEKVDGTRMMFDGQDIYSDRNICRNDRFPHIVKELRRLDWQVRTEFAIPHGNVHHVNKKEYWSKAKCYLLDIFESQGKNVEDATPKDNREMIEDVFKNHRFWHLRRPRQFPTPKDGWDYVLYNNNKLDKYVEGIILKGQCGQWKVKFLREEKLPIVGYEDGKEKGAFIISRKGIQGKVSATSVAHVIRYKQLLAQGLTPFAEIEYPFVTDHGKLFQPRLRRIGTLQELK